MSVFRLLVFSCLRTVILLRMYNLKKRRPSIWDRARDLSLKKNAKRTKSKTSLFILLLFEIYKPELKRVHAR